MTLFASRRAIIIATLIILFASLPANAHHVDTAETVTDADAFTAYVSEYVAQKRPLVEAVQLYQAATSSTEKADAADATLQHMESLDVRTCFEDVAVMVLAEFTALERAFHVATGPTLYALEIAQAGRIASGMSNAIVEAVFLCAPEVAA